MQKLSESLTFLQKFYGKSLPEEGAKFYLRDFRNVDEEVFARGVQECCRNETRFPTVTTLNRYMVVQREREWQRYKKEQGRSVEPQWKRVDPVYGKEAWALIKRILLSENHPEHLCGLALVEEMERMEKKWPGWGWVEEARAYKQWLEQWNGLKKAA